MLHGDRSGLARRARRLHKSRGTIEYFGSSIAMVVWLKIAPKYPGLAVQKQVVGRPI